MISKQITKIIQRIKDFPWYTLAFVAFPVLSLLGENIDQVDPGVIWRPLFLCALGCLSFYGAFRLIWKNWHRAALWTSVFILLFFAYGHVYHFLEANHFTTGLAKHRYLLVVWCLVLVIGFWWVSRIKGKLHSISPLINLLSILLLIYPLFQITSFLNAMKEAKEERARQISTSLGLKPLTEPAPDIYFIVLDSYARADLLSERYGYDNSKFLQALEDRGFFVADCSQSNYSQTLLSLSSTLNMAYHSIPDEEKPKDTRTAELTQQLKNNQVVANLKSMGYKTVSFDTGYYYLNWDEFDDFISPQNKLHINDFENLLIQTTALKIIVPDFEKIPVQVPAAINSMDTFSLNPEKQAAEAHRERIVYTLAELDTYVNTLRGPKFVLVELLVPHYPFVFGPNGEEIEPVTFLRTDEPTFEEYANGYIDQVNYISTEIIRSVDSILARSATPPIIIIQGDHGAWLGPGEENSVFNLNAIYFPNGPDGLYETITPVNTFRLIFNNYFDGNYDILEDVARWSPYKNYYDFEIIPNQCNRSVNP